jgi:hypothetical protein
MKPSQARRQPSCDDKKAEFYEALTALLAAMPRPTTVQESLASHAGPTDSDKVGAEIREAPPL